MPRRPRAEEAEAPGQEPASAVGEHPLRRIPRWPFAVCVSGGADPPNLLSKREGTPITTVEALRALCTQAACGVRDQTVVDTSVRRTLRAGPDVISVEWADLPKVLRTVKDMLPIGVAQDYEVTVQLHDVLLYQQGDFFLRHRDSKKAPDHQMTLVVDCGLAGTEPCEGGELVFTETVATPRNPPKGKQPEVGKPTDSRCGGPDLRLPRRLPALDADPDPSNDSRTVVAEWKSKSGGAFCAWYANVFHEVKPVTAGQRAVAVFNVLVSAPAPYDQVPEATHLWAHCQSREFNTLVEALRGMKVSAAAVAREKGKQFVGIYLENPLSFDGERRGPPKNLHGYDRALALAMPLAWGIAPTALEVATWESLRIKDYVRDETYRGDRFLLLDNQQVRQFDDPYDNPSLACCGYEGSPEVFHATGDEYAKTLFLNDEAKYVVDETYYQGNDAPTPFYFYQRAYLRVALAALMAPAPASVAVVAASVAAVSAPPPPARPKPKGRPREA